jgi:hypothetical protein
MPMDEPGQSEREAQLVRELLKRYPNPLDEDEVKELLKGRLESEGWQVKVKRGRTHGIDVEATKGTARWIIEAKGFSAKVSPVEYFKDVLGEILQRMESDGPKYSIAFPDIKDFRNLWERLPGLAKRRAGISCLFVDKEGRVVES